MSRGLDGSCTIWHESDLSAWHCLAGHFLPWFNAALHTHIINSTTYDVVLTNSCCPFSGLVSETPEVVIDWKISWHLKQSILYSVAVLFARSINALHSRLLLTASEVILYRVQLYFFLHFVSHVLSCRRYYIFSTSTTYTTFIATCLYKLDLSMSICPNVLTFCLNKWIMKCQQRTSPTFLGVVNVILWFTSIPIVLSLAFIGSTNCHTRNTATSIIMMTATMPRSCVSFTTWKTHVLCLLNWLL